MYRSICDNEIYSPHTFMGLLPILSPNKETHIWCQSGTYTIRKRNQEHEIFFSHCPQSIQECELLLLSKHWQVHNPDQSCQNNTTQQDTVWSLLSKVSLFIKQQQEATFLQSDIHTFVRWILLQAILLSAQ